MVYAGLIFARLAALLHVYIWAMEPLTWTSARTRATFGITEEEAFATKELAFNTPARPPASALPTVARTLGFGDV
jgi:putative membrane protein